MMLKSVVLILLNIVLALGAIVTIYHGYEFMKGMYYKHGNVKVI